MEALSTTAETILAIVGGILVIMNFVDKIKAWKKPEQDRIKAVNERLTNHESELKDLNRRLESLEKDCNMLLQTQLAVLEHMITGNSVENLKKTNKRVQDYIVSERGEK